MPTDTPAGRRPPRLMMLASSRKGCSKMRFKNAGVRSRSVRPRRRDDSLEASRAGATRGSMIELKYVACTGCHPAPSTRRRSDGSV